MVNPAFLRTFVTLTETRSFTRAARQLGMTQPGVSQHLKGLETYYGMKLVVRDPAFELTEAGLRLLEYSRNLFTQHEALRVSLLRDDPGAGLCRLASPGSFGMKMYSFLLRLNRRYPDLVLHFVYAPNTTVVREVLSDELDGGFVTLEPREPELAWKEIDRERLCLVLPRASRAKSFADLVALGFVGHPDGPYYASRLLRENFPEEFRAMNQLPIRWYTNQVTRILEPVAAGRGFTALPEYACRAFPDQRRIRYLRLPRTIDERVYWIHKRSRKMPARFDRILREFQREKTDHLSRS
jgi:DNA-binding transcriptional LysR family regulator